MAIVLSNGQPVSNTMMTPQSDGWSYPLFMDHTRGFGGTDFYRAASFDYIYRHQPSVRKVVRKIVSLQSMVPMKVYRQRRAGRELAASMPFGRLMAAPSKRMSTDEFWRRMWTMYLVHGISFGYLSRDGLNGVEEILPIHPLRMRHGEDRGDGVKVPRDRWTAEERSTGMLWWFNAGDGVEVQIPRRDLWIRREINLDDPHLGMSLLEPLLPSLEDDAAARAAMEAIWKNGGNPGFVIKGPDNFENHPRVIEQIAQKFKDKHSGVAKWHKPLVLDFGMDVQELRTDKNLEYLSLRKVTDVEVAALFDITGPAVHILDEANFASVSELLRDIFRSTMPPQFASLRSSLEFDIRDGRHGEDEEPNFSSVFFLDHVMEGVLAGSPEQQIAAAAQQIQTAQRTVNEIRAINNEAPVDGGDVLLINAALVPVKDVAEGRVGPVEPVAVPSTPAPTVADDDADGVGGALSRGEFAAVMGRLSRVSDVASVDVGFVCEGLSDGGAEVVARVVAMCLESGGSVVDLRGMLKGLKDES